MNDIYFVIRHGKIRKRKDIFQILYQLRVEFIFLYFGIKAYLVEILKYFLNMPVMFRHIIHVNKYIIQINYNIDIQEIGKKIIYKLLESCKSISKTKGYYGLLKQSIICFKGSLPFITISNTNQVISIMKIYLYIYLSFVG